ncbi:MAG: adenine phosphoribosyltransferase [Prevotella sp.]|jgi:adenine phosphoribosyltransferase|nr:adenine phosphoribosyltransferase [Prevotella sp.]
MEKNNQLLMDNLRCIPDFPQKGINFRDVTTLFKSAECLQEMLNELYEIYKDKGITKIVGIESRGFVMASALAVKLGAGVVLCRKPGKLPAATVQESYTKEYGTDTIEIHKDAIDENDVVLLHDDLLATGGTMKAAYNLVKKFNPKNIYVNFIIEIRDEGLHGRDIFDKETEITTLIDV